MEHPPPTIAAPMPKRVKRTDEVVATVPAPVQTERKGGLLGRVKRGVMRTLGV
jgi:hypothetical protein